MTRTPRITRLGRRSLLAPATLVAALAVLSLASAAIADSVMPAKATQGRLISMNVRPNVGNTERFLKVPAGKLFLLTQACVEHPQARITVEQGVNLRHDGRLTFGARGCTSFRPAYVIKAGETLSCVNKSGLRRSCTMTGELIDDPHSGSRRAVFIDVDEALRAQKKAD